MARTETKTDAVAKPGEIKPATTSPLDAVKVQARAPKVPEARVREQEAARAGRKKYVCFVKRDKARGLYPFFSRTFAGITFAVSNNKQRTDESEPHVRSPGHINWVSDAQWAEFRRIIEFYAVRWNAKTGAAEIYKTSVPSYSPENGDVSVALYLGWREMADGEERFDDAGVEIVLAQEPEPAAA